MMHSKYVGLGLILSFLAGSFAKNPLISEHKMSFDRWNQWLEDYARIDNPEEDKLALLDKSGRVIRTEEFSALDPIKLVSKSHGLCDSAVIEALVSIAAGANPSLEAKRINRLVKSLITLELYQNCEKFLNDEFNKLINSYKQEPEIQNLFERLTPNPLNDPSLKDQDDSGKVAIYRNWLEGTTDEIPTDTLDVDQMADALISLSEDDPRGQYKHPFNYEATVDPKYLSNFKYAFDKYLAQPCKKYESIFGDYFDTVYAIKTIDPKQVAIDSRVGPAIATNPVIFDTQSNDFFVHLFKFKMCRSITNISNKGLSSVFSAIQDL